jgi:hypothetical protein
MPRGRPKKNSNSETTSENSTTVSTINSEGKIMKNENIIDNNFGPSLFQRDEHGLLKNVQYVFDEGGSINWRAMVKEEHLFPNKSHFERFNKPLPRSIEGLKDHQLLIKLSGIKELARLRGFDSVHYDMVKCEENHVAVKCGISFISNYETGERVLYEDMANATINNCSSFAVKFLETIACNRAFVRAVRNFLNIHIVGLDEMDTSDPSSPHKSTNSTNSSTSFSIHSTLEKNAKEYANCSNFECFKDYLLELKNSNAYINSEAESWNDYLDIPSKEARILLKLLKDQFA